MFNQTSWKCVRKGRLFLQLVVARIKFRKQNHFKQQGLRKILTNSLKIQSQENTKSCMQKLKFLLNLQTQFIVHNHMKRNTNRYLGILVFIRSKTFDYDLNYKVELRNYEIHSNNQKKQHLYEIKYIDVKLYFILIIKESRNSQQINVIFINGIHYEFCHKYGLMEKQINNMNLSHIVQNQ
ncbi:unnamed protein product [Paramecium sonneborni]|uniref:Uncharacterized protein n=1 Tax=Paramecium sonneborni TaxID=65129 RepID=A0A8S1RMK8_9CILI|nr:unnamed protein product [Paramecium sonneborni]